MKNNKEKEEWYKKMLEMDLYHSVNSMPDLEETNEGEELMDKVIQRIEEHSKGLPVNEKRCILCDTIAVGRKGGIGACECHFLYFDYDFDTGKYSRYVIDLDRLKK